MASDGEVFVLDSAFSFRDFELPVLLKSDAFRFSEAFYFEDGNPVEYATTDGPHRQAFRFPATNCQWVPMSPNAPRRPWKQNPAASSPGKQSATCPVFGRTFVDFWTGCALVGKSLGRVR